MFKGLLPRKNLFATSVAVGLLALAPVQVSAQVCNPQRIVVGFATGGGADALARLMADRLRIRTGRTVIVENKVGGGGNIASVAVARSAPDGCTLMLTGNHHNLNPLLFDQAGYKATDFTAVAQLIESASVIVTGANSPFKTLGAAIEYARANPGKLSYGSSGIGSPNHIAMELLLKAAGVQMTHVPYRGAGPALLDTIGGVVPLTVGSVAAVEPHLMQGKLRALAVSSPKRWPSLPEVPSMAEAGFPDASNVIWNGLFGPAGMPAATRARLLGEVHAAMQEPEVRDRLKTMGLQPVFTSAAEFDAFLREDERQSKRLMDSLKLKIE